MKSNLPFAGVAVVGISIVAPVSAWAMPNFPDLIPNGRVNECANCHINPEGGGARNAFGQDFGSMSRSWANVFDLDSDGDGDTNGEELGDPMGIWTVGAVPSRTTNISLPGAPPPDPAQPDPTQPDPPGDDEGGCTAATGPGNISAWTLLLGGLFVSFIRRRTHR